MVDIDPKAIVYLKKPKSPLDRKTGGEKYQVFPGQTTNAFGLIKCGNE